MSEAIVVALAQTKLVEIETLAAKLGAAEAMLEAGYGELAFALKEMRDNKYWIGTYDSFGDYKRICATRTIWVSRNCTSTCSRHRNWAAS